jgi:hypothetical protein
MYTAREFSKLLEDIKRECEEFTQLTKAFIIKPINTMLGAEVGAIFVEAKDEVEAINLLEGMQGKTYNGRKFDMICLPEVTYLNHFVLLSI